MLRYAGLAPSELLGIWLSRQLSPQLWSHVRGHDRPPLLLTIDDFEDLASAIEETPTGGSIMDWTGYPSLHADYVRCLPGIREQLAPATADRFAEQSLAFGRRLEAPRMKLWDGVRVVSDWVSEVRDLLRAAGATHLLPRPEGRARTPLFPDANLSQNVERIVERTLDRFRKDPGLARLSKSDLRARVTGKTADVNAALDYLRDRGLYPVRGSLRSAGLPLAPGSTAGTT